MKGVCAVLATMVMLVLLAVGNGADGGPIADARAQAPTAATNRDYYLNGERLCERWQKPTHIDFSLQILGQVGPNLFRVATSNGGNRTWIITDPTLLRGIRSGLCPTNAPGPGGLAPPQARAVRPQGGSPFPGTYTVGFYPVWSVRGDFDGDGIDDAAVANLDSHNVSILLGKPDGSYLTAVNYPAGTSPNSLAIADFNGDGKRDLLVGGSQQARILLGNGNGSFQAPLVITPAGFEPFVLTGDFNHDGHADVALTNTTNVASSVLILLGQGNATFQPSVSYPVGVGPREIRAGDLNNDGHLDLISANTHSNDVSVLLGNSDGTFRTAVQYPAGRRPWALAIADLNRDGKLDVAVSSNQASTFSVLLGTGTGAFGAATDYAVGDAPVSLAVGDASGDGIPDLLFANFASDNGSLVVGNGDGAFRAPRIYRTVSQPVGGPSSVAIGDFNGDSQPDLAVANFLAGENSNGVAVLLASAGSFQPAVHYATIQGPVDIVTADFNADGKLDLAVVNSSFSRVSLLLGNGNGSFQGPVHYPTAPTPQNSPRPVALAAADLNGDGRLDLVTANDAQPGVSVLLGVAGGAFQAPTTYDVPLRARKVAVGDLNADGKPDLVVTNTDPFDPFPFVQPSYASVLLGNGNGTFQPAANHSAGKSADAVAIGDFNRDGFADVAVGNFEAITTLLGNGKGAFTTTTSTTPEFFFGSEMVAVDVDGDGLLDLAAGNGSQVYVFRGLSNGAFQIAASADASSGVNGLAVGDFNGDMKPDLAATAFEAGGVTILLNSSAPAPFTPTPTATPTRTPTTTPVPSALGGHGFSLETNPGGPAVARWAPGTLQTGYIGIRITLPSGDLTLFPPTGVLPANATGFDDPSPPDIACYTALVQVNYGNTDGLCLFRNVASGSAPRNFTIRLDETNTSKLSWNPPVGGGQTGYTLVVIPTDATGVQLVPLNSPAATSTTHDTFGKIICYQLVVTGPVPGQTDALCAFPGASTLAAGVQADPATRLRQLRDRFRTFIP